MVLDMPKTEEEKSVGIKHTDDKYTQLNAAQIPNFAMVTNNGTNYKLDQNIRRRTCPTNDSAN